MVDGIFSRIAKANGCAFGCDSYFVKIDDNVGVKLFRSKLMRDRNYDRHIKYAIIAPKVGGKFAINFKGKKMWGFYVEVVLTYNELVRDNDDPKKTQRWRKIEQDIWQKQSMHFRNDQFIDLHLENFGQTKDGRSVIIDFSRFQDDDGFVYHSLKNAAYAICPRDGYHKQITIKGDEWKFRGV